jgi:hypothetical protein
MTFFGGPEGFRPAYLDLGPGELEDRALRAVQGLASCRVCPRDCDVNRLEDRWAACKTGRRYQPGPSTRPAPPGGDRIEAGGRDARAPSP